MATVVHHQGSEGDILEEAIKLELDCIAAYGAAADGAPSPRVREALGEWAAAHRGHLESLRARRRALAMSEVGANPLTHALNRAKVAIGAPLGVAALFAVIDNNARDAETAYSEISGRVELPAATRELFARMRDTARQHKGALHALRVAEGLG